MLTDLIVAGLLVASSAGLPPTGGVRPAPAGAQPETGTEAIACAGGRASDRAALLEAHAGFAALPPFSLARTPVSTATRPGPGDKGDPGCKS